MSCLHWPFIAEEMQSLLSRYSRIGIRCSLNLDSIYHTAGREACLSATPGHELIRAKFLEGQEMAIFTLSESCQLDDDAIPTFETSTSTGSGC